MIRDLYAGRIRAAVRVVLDPHDGPDATFLFASLPRYSRSVRRAVLDELAVQLEAAPSDANAIRGVTSTVYSWYRDRDPEVRAAAIRLTRFADPDVVRASHHLESTAGMAHGDLAGLARRELGLLRSIRQQYIITTQTGQALLDLIDERINAVEVYSRPTQSEYVEVYATVWSTGELSPEDEIVEELSSYIDERCASIDNPAIVDTQFRAGWPASVNSTCVFLKYRKGSSTPALEAWCGVPAKNQTDRFQYYPTCSATFTVALRGIITDQWNLVLLNLEEEDSVVIDVYFDGLPDPATEASYQVFLRVIDSVPSEMPIVVNRHTGPRTAQIPAGSIYVFARADPGGTHVGRVQD